MITGCFIKNGLKMMNQVYRRNCGIASENIIRSNYFHGHDIATEPELLFWLFKVPSGRKSLFSIDSILTLMAVRFAFI